MAEEDLSGAIDIQQRVQQKQLANLEMRIAAMTAGQAVFDALVLERIRALPPGGLIDSEKIREIAAFAQRIGFYRLHTAGLCAVDESRHWGPADQGKARP